MERSDALNELAAALAKAQAVIRDAKESGHNDHLKTRYSTLADLWAACREPLAANGLSVVQTTEDAEQGWVRLRTTLLHASGQWLSAALPLPVGKHDPQSYGSALTYARKYGLSALVGVVSAEGDDDAEGAKQPESRGDRQAARREPQQSATAAMERQESYSGSPALERDSRREAECAFHAKFGEVFPACSDHERHAILTVAKWDQRGDRKSPRITTQASWTEAQYRGGTRWLEGLSPEQAAKLRTEAKNLLDEDAAQLDPFEPGEGETPEPPVYNAYAQGA